MTTETKDGIAALRRSHDELAAFVRGLDAADLERQSGSTEWTVADVLSHLGSAAEIGRATLSAGKADMQAAPAIWDRWNAMSPVEKAQHYLEADALYVEAFEALDDEALADTTIDLGFFPAPVDLGFYSGMRLSEVGLHSWDIAVAFDPAATVPEYILPFVLGMLPTFASFLAKPIGKTGTVVFDTTDLDGHYLLELGADSAKLTEGGDDAGATHVSLSADAFARLTGGRLRPEYTPAAVTVEGDLSLDDLRGVFPGY
jgi:uncharacterized protein (TIGR03083 family)